MPKPIPNSIGSGPSSTQGKARFNSGTTVRVVMVIFGVLVAGIVIVAVGVYAAQWHSAFVKSFTRAIPIPAASVNGKWLSYRSFLEANDTLTYSLSQPEVLQASGFTKKPSPQELSILVLDRMVKDEMVRQLARQRGVTVKAADADAEMKRLVDQTGSSADVASKIQKLYHWDLNTFRAQVVVPFLLRQRLQDNIAADDAINAQEQERARALLARVATGKEDFEAIAREVNEDVTKGAGGDLGVIGKGEREASLEEAAFGLKIGETSQLVRSREGFHILKLLEKIPGPDPSGADEKVHIAHIFISAKPLDTWLFEQSKSQRVRVLLTAYRWDVSNARVVAKKS